jgi:zinc D-Ala-D-Ala carboxypeptidase
VPRSHNIYGLILAGLVVVLSLIGMSDNATAPQTTVRPAGNTSKTIDEPAVAAFDKAKYSIDEPASPWVIINKARPLPAGYRPADLRAPAVKLRLGASNEEMMLRTEAASALESMVAAAAVDGLELMVASGFRSQSSQTNLYNRYVAQDGQALADTYSARPGHSEHQTGWALDIEPASRKCEVEVCFGELAEGQWVKANSIRFGFIIRYQADKQLLTGYTYEPWHLRYVGVELAQELSRVDQTMEQFFELEPAVNY